MERVYLAAHMPLKGTTCATLFLCPMCNVPPCPQGTERASWPAPSLPLSSLMCLLPSGTKACPIWGFAQCPFPSCNAGQCWPSICPACEAVLLLCVELCHSELFQLLPMLGDEAELTSQGPGQHGLGHIKQVTAGGDSARPTISQPPCSARWGPSHPLPSSGMAIAGWRSVCWGHSSPQRH